jgi:hypothetical protein
LFPTTIAGATAVYAAYQIEAPPTSQRLLTTICRSRPCQHSSRRRYRKLRRHRYNRPRPSGPLAAIEAADTISFLGSVFTGTISGQLLAVEAPDIAAFGRGVVLAVGTWVDYGREKRRKTRGLRQAEKFFEQQRREAQERLEEIAEQAKIEASEARQTGEMERAQAILLEANRQQERQQQVINNMLAQARARVEQARLELAQLEAVGRALEADEEEAITVLLLH